MIFSVGAYDSFMKLEQDKLFYDARCPQCTVEIKLLRRWKSPSLDLIDLHDLNAESTEIGKSEMLSILHLQTYDGNWLKGVDAGVRAWRHTPFGWLFKPLRWPIISSIADTAYARWAKRRACRLGYQTR